MLTSSFLLASLMVAAGQSVSSYPADQTLKGCGYSVDAGGLAVVRWGVFLDSQPPFADINGFSVQIGEEWVHPDKSPFRRGQGRAWFDKDEQIDFKGGRYAKDGLPMVFGLDEVKHTGEFDGLPVAEGSALSPQAPGTILILVDPAGCGWQRYLPVQ